jgi:arginine N-succinyltransferase
LLEEQGFRYDNHVDIFDAGPLLRAELAKVKTIMESKVVTISKLQPPMENSIMSMIYNSRLKNARTTVEKIQILDNDNAIISPRTAEMLEVAVGDQIRFCHLKE